MESLKFTDDLLAPKSKLKFEIKGKEPFKVVKMMPSIIKYILRITSTDLFSPVLKWDASGETREFYAEISGEPKKDKWSKVIVKAKVRGTQNHKTKEGKVTVELKGVLQTEYTYSIFIQRLFWLLYNKYFYYEQRRRYLAGGRKDIETIKTEVLSLFGLAEKPI